MPDFEFEVPGDPPSLNDTYQVVTVAGKGRLAKKGHVLVWQTHVAWAAKIARPSGWMPARRTVIEYEMFTIRAGRDADGPVKALLDGIKVGLGCDDNGFLPRAMSNEKDRDHPRVVVRVTNL